MVIILHVDTPVLFIGPMLMHCVVQIYSKYKYQRATSKKIYHLTAVMSLFWGSSVAKQQVGILTFSAKVTPSSG